MRSTASMMISWLAVCLTIGPALATKHYMFSGFFSGTQIVGLDFDDLTSELTLVNNITTLATGGSKWIAIDVRLKNLYVGTTGYFQSYAITDDLSLTYETNVSLSSNCKSLALSSCVLEAL